MTEQPLLPINDMSGRHIGLSLGLATSYHEAARVCLDAHHKSPVGFSVENDDSPSSVRVEWAVSNDALRNAWRNEIDAAEAAGYCFAIAATELIRELFAVSRAETRTGADYYLASKGRSMNDLEDCIRLEVSGTSRGTISYLRQTLVKKSNQARRGASNLPALAAVVGFLNQKILVKSVDKPI